MKLEVLMSCMYQTDDRLVSKSGLTGDVVVINQCDREEVAVYPTANGTTRMFSTTQRGLTKSRNMAIGKACGDICLLCDDDESFVPDYEDRILGAYQDLPQADLIVFKVEGKRQSLPEKVMRLKFPQTMRVSSWQISFRREKLLAAGVRFDELLGAGTGNGAEEELKFLLECQRAGLVMYYVPVTIASVAQQVSTWFKGYDEKYFENRGATTRYIMGFFLASAYAVYYVIDKRHTFAETLTPAQALRATFRGILENKITKQAKNKK